MKNLVALSAIALLAACGSKEPAPAPTPTVAAAPTPTTPALPAPNQTVFAGVFAKACKGAPKVSTSTCKAAGMGSPNFICQYGLGDDKYLRNTLTLTQSGDEWTIMDPDKVCAEAAAG